MTDQTQAVNPIQVEKYLKGADYPANKQNLLECAENNSAPQDITECLSCLPEKEYNSPAEVNQEISNIH